MATILPYIVLFFIGHTASQDIFRGGTLSWEPYHVNQARNTYEVLFKYRMTWKYASESCGELCEPGDMWTLTKGNDLSSIRCVNGCGSQPVKISDSIYIVSTSNKQEDWVQGHFQFPYIFHSPGPFTIAFEGHYWISMGSIHLTKSPWRMQTVVNLFPRSDTNGPNHSPSASFAPVYKEFVNCLQDIQIPVADTDGDTVRCRWAETEAECGGVCRGLPGASLNEDCTIRIVSTANYGMGYYPVAIVIEDFPLTEVTVNDVTYDNLKPFSQIPVQFLIFMAPPRIQCDRPEFFNTSLTNGKQISVRPEQTFKEVVCARGHGSDIVTHYSVTSPVGMHVNVTNIVEIGSLCLALKWTPSKNQTGSHFLCYTAEQNTRINSPAVCVTLRVDETDECLSSPCPADQVCVDGFDRFTCDSQNVTNVGSISGPITSVRCLSTTIDLVFVLDSSDSLEESDMTEMRQFLEDVIGIFGVSPDTTHVGVVLYDDSVHPQFYLNEYTSTDDVLSALDNMTFVSGGTNTGGAIQYMYETMFSSEKGDRQGVPNVAVVLTDGHSKDSYATKYHAKAAREKGITLFAVGIGPQIDHTELKDIGNSPSDQFVLVVDKFDDLASVAKHLKEAPCSVRLPNTTQFTTATPRTGCFNAKDDCRIYGEDVCTDFPGWSADNCAMWCGFGSCNGSTTPPPPCVDVIRNCRQYGSSVCEIPSYRGWAQDNCRAFCGLCAGVSPPTTLSTTTPIPLSTTQGLCLDKLDNCHSYHPKNASCYGPFEGWARANCPVWCGYCPIDYVEVPPTVIGNLTCPGWKLPKECNLRQFGNCCPMPECPAGYKLTVEREHH